MQVEAAEVIVVNKTDATTAQALPHIRELLRSLNPAALLFETSWGAVPLFEVPRLSTLCPSHHAQRSLCALPVALA
jgi:G3E family GTPase